MPRLTDIDSTLVDFSGSCAKTARRSGDGTGSLSFPQKIKFMEINNNGSTTHKK